jgi:hypothetical protein
MNAQTVSHQTHPWKRWLLIGGGLVCLAAWIALFAGLALDVERGRLLVLATAAALSTEALVWLAALALGLKVFEARRVLIGRLASLVAR